VRRGRAGVLGISAGRRPGRPAARLFYPRVGVAMNAAGMSAPRQKAPVTWDDGFPIAPSRRWAAATVLFIMTGMAVLDLTVANVAIPHLSGNLGASLDQGTWVITSYAVAEAIAVPLSGWLVGRFGIVRMMLVSISGFSLFSLLCGLSVTLPMLVICRIGQGLCGGPMLPVAQTLFFRIFPAPQVPKALAVWTLVFTLAPAIGPIVGGAIVDEWSWHWIFLINVPLGVVAVVWGYVLLRPAETIPVRAPVDLVGLGLLILWVGSLQLMLDTGRDKDWFADPGIVALAVVAALGLCAFVIWELTEDHPIVDVRLLGNRPFALCLIGGAMSYGAFFIGIVVVPQWLQSVMGYSATQAGWVTASSAVVGLASSQMTLRLMYRTDPRILVTIGGFLAALALVWRTAWSTDFDMYHFVMIFAVQGVGVMMMQMPLNNMGLSTLTYAQSANGSGLSVFVRTTSAAMSTALALTFWNGQQAVSRDAMVQSIHPDSAVAALSSVGLQAGASASYVGALVDRQANTVALLHTFTLSAVALVIAAVGVWVIPRIELTRIKGTQEGMGEH